MNNLIDNNNRRLICQCKDGWRQVSNKNNNSDLNFCIPYVRCNSSTMEFNEYYIQGDCKSPNQFCRQNLCLCLPNYEFDNTGQCVLESGLGLEEKSFFEQHFAVIISSFIVIIVLALTILIIQQYIKNKFVYRPPRKNG